MTLTVAFLDVFHGDCAVIIFNERGRKACIVIDGGEKRDAAKRLAAYLKHEKVEVIDLLVATHIDSDHVNGLVHFLKSESTQTDSWNKGKEKCIVHYWGPKPDPHWIPPSRRRGAQTSPLTAPELQTMNFVIQSVAQNQKLSKLVQKHIFHTDNIQYPSLQDMPPLDIFENVRLQVMAPDTQILDSAIQSKALSLSNVPYRQSLAKMAPVRTAGRLKLKDLRKILAMNAEEMAKIADRNANNQSIVLKLTPREGKAAEFKGWTFLFTGDAEQESWEMMRQIAQVRKNLPSRVLKVPHHGSSLNGIDKASFKAINPEYSIISVGQKHGLPDGQTLNLIRADRERKLFCTERNNSVHHPGPCMKKRTCIRKRVSDFRSIRFVIDTDTGEEKIDTFTINAKLGEIEIKTGEIWCPGNKWPTKQPISKQKEGGNERG